MNIRLGARLDDWAVFARGPRAGIDEAARPGDSRRRFVAARGAPGTAALRYALSRAARVLHHQTPCAGSCVYGDEWFEPELDERPWLASSSLTTRFPWVNYSADESNDGYDKPTRWLGGSTRYDESGRSNAPGVRARVPYPGE